MRELGWRTARGADVSPGGASAERGGYEEVALEGILQDALRPAQPRSAIWRGSRRGGLLLKRGAHRLADGAEARVGTLTAGWEWFKPWRTIDGESSAPPETPQPGVLLAGICERVQKFGADGDFIRNRRKRERRGGVQPRPAIQ